MRVGVAHHALFGSRRVCELHGLPGSELGRLTLQRAETVFSSFIVSRRERKLDESGIACKSLAQGLRNSLSARRRVSVEHLQSTRLARKAGSSGDMAFVSLTKAKPPLKRLKVELVYNECHG